MPFLGLPDGTRLHTTILGAGGTPVVMLAAGAREEEIAGAGGRAAWELQVLDSPEAWLLRITVVQDTIAAAIRASQTGYIRR